MKKTIALISTSGISSEFPPAPHLIEKHLSDKFTCRVVSRQSEPEPSWLAHHWNLISTCLFRRQNIIHTFDSFGATLVCIRRVWDAGPYWIHTPLQTHNKLLSSYQRFLQKRCDQVYLKSGDFRPDFATHLENANSDLDYLKNIYVQNSFIGIAMLAPLLPGTQIRKQIQLHTTQLDKKYHLHILQRANQPVVTEDTPTVTIWNTRDPFGKINEHETWKKLIVSFLFFVAGLFKLLRYRHRFQIIHAFQLYAPTTLGVFVRMLLRKPLIVRVTSSGYTGEKKTLSTLPLYDFRLKSFSKIDRVIVLSHEMSAEMRELGFIEDKIKLIPDGVTVPAESFDREFSGETFKMLYRGRLSTANDVEHILEAAQMLSKKGFRLQITLCGGKGYQRDAGPRLKALAYSIRKSVDVKFMGELTDARMLYTSHDCLILTSKIENLSETLLEAQSVGTPCIACDTLANRFVVEDSVNGLIYRQGNPYDLAKKMEILVTDKQNGSLLAKNICSESQRIVREKFSTAKVTTQMQNVYEDLLRRSTQSSF